MLGEQVFQQTGKITGKRVLDETTVEMSFDAKINVKGVDGMNMGTYMSAMLPDGSMTGDGVGCVMSSDGQMLTWKSMGIGRFLQDGKIRFTGCVRFSTHSKGSFASLNNTISVFEHDADMEGNISTKGWEWK